MSRSFTAPIQISLHRVAELRNDTPLAKVVESFFVSNSMKPKTRAFYQTHFSAFDRLVTQQLGHEATLADLNHDYVNTYIRALETTPSPSYPKGSPFRARAAATSLKRLANWLVEESVLKESPLRRVKKTKELKDVRQPLSDEEMDRLLNQAGEPGDKYHAMIVFLAGTGLRLNEAREARISDLHLRDCEIVIRAETCKVGVARTVVFHEGVAKVMDRYLRNRESRPDDPLFATDEGIPYTESGFGKVFQRLADSSGVRRFHAHLLRHTWATNFMKGDGANLLQLKRQGGWSRMDMVERYSHATPENRATLPNPMGVAKIAKFTPRKAETA